jgi:hypothetical protein
MLPKHQSDIAEAAGSVTFGNLNTTTGSYYYVVDWQYLAAGFTVPVGPDQTVGMVKITIETYVSGNLTLKFYDDNSGLPGNELASLGSETIAPSAQQTVTFTPNSTLNLVGGNTYYFSMVPDAAYYGGWYFGPTAPTGGGFVSPTPGMFSTNDQGSSWRTEANYLDFEISFNEAALSSSPAADVIPAFNPNDDRLNRAAGDEGEPVAIYQGSVDVYGVDPVTSQGVLEVRVTDEEIEAAGVPSESEWGRLLASSENRATGMPIEVYRLATGEFQVNTYYASGKPYIFRWHPDRPDEGVHVAW